MFKSIFNKIFSKERLIWLIIILILCGIIWALSSSKNEYKDNYYIAVENTKAYQQQLTNNQKEIIAFKFTI